MQRFGVECCNAYEIRGTKCLHNQEALKQMQTCKVENFNFNKVLIVFIFRYEFQSYENVTVMGFMEPGLPIEGGFSGYFNKYKLN